MKIQNVSKKNQSKKKHKESFSDIKIEVIKETWGIDEFNQNKEDINL